MFNSLCKKKWRNTLSIFLGLYFTVLKENEFKLKFINPNIFIHNIMNLDKFKISH